MKSFKISSDLAMALSGILDFGKFGSIFKVIIKRFWIKIPILVQANQSARKNNQCEFLSNFLDYFPWHFHEWFYFWNI